jgi:hypothetical protein
VLVYNLIHKEHSYKHDLHNNQGEHARNIILAVSSKKVFDGPHFCITKLCLNKVTKVGVLKKI